MKPIELKTPPEQTQTITRVIFDILKEHGPLTIADTWEHVQVLAPLPKKKKVTGCWSGYSGDWKVMSLNCISKF